MKLINTLLPLAATAAAFIIPDEEIAGQVFGQSSKEPQTFFGRLQGSTEKIWSDVEETFKHSVAFSENAIDHAINAGEDAAGTFECHMSMTKFDVGGFLSSGISAWNQDADINDGHYDNPHHPQHPHRPHHGHDHHKPNKTVYELIAGSKYTTILAKLIGEYPDLVKVLNSTSAGNITVFAPTDKAFKKIPSHHKPSKELIKKVLAYHVSPDFYPAGRILLSRTIPTTLGEDALGGEPQRLRVGVGLTKGLNVNFYSRVVAVNIFGTNGVIHGVDSILLPPPPGLKIIELLPTEFSTLQLGLEKTGLFADIKSANHEGGTLFAPSNWAFKKLGPKINAFLFSKYGEKYLKALLKYHIVANQTLYSDAFYKAKSAELKVEDDIVDDKGIPNGLFHVDLPTILKDKSLSIDIAKFGGFIKFKINGFSSVAVLDGIAKDGVIHVLSSILIPPKALGGAHHDGEDISVEELKDRLSTYVEEL